MIHILPHSWGASSTVCYSPSGAVEDWVQAQGNGGCVSSLLLPSSRPESTPDARGSVILKRSKRNLTKPIRMGPEGKEKKEKSFFSPTTL